MYRSFRFQRLLLKVFVGVCLLALTLMLARPLPVRAAALTWDGGGTSNFWSDCANWNLDNITCPVAGDTVTFDATSSDDVIIDVDVTVASMTVATGYGGNISLGIRAITVTGAYVQAAGTFSGGTGTIRFGSFQLTGGTFTAPMGKMYVSGNFTNNIDGTFNHGSGSLILNGTSTQALGGTTTTNFYDLTLNEGLMGYWKFDEGSGLIARDSSGNGFDGNLTIGSAPAYITYVTTIPSATAFSDPYAISMASQASDPLTNTAWIDMGNLSQFMNLGDFTISQWVLLNNVSSGSPHNWAMPIGKGTYNLPGWLVLFNRGPFVEGHIINLYLNSGNAANIVATIQAPSGGWVAGQWYHYAFTRSGATIRGYLNGVAQPAPPDDATVPGTNIASLAIGLTAAGSYFWDGQIDETRIYNRGLAAAEIQALASGHHPNSSIDTVTLSAPINVSHQLRINSGTFDVSAGNYAVAIQGDLERNGGLFVPSGGTVTFNGSGIQNLNTDAFTFNNVAVGTGVTLATAAEVTVTNVLTNSGVTHETRPVSGISAVRFGLASITITPTVQGSLSGLDVLRQDQDHPNHTGTAGHGVGWGRYWTITPNTGANDTFSATLTLPQNALIDPRACKYPGNLGGAGWDCDDGTYTTSDASTVTRSGIGSFSDWAVGGQVGPTAITLHSIGATSYTSPLAFMLFATVLIMIGTVLAWRRKR